MVGIHLSIYPPWYTLVGTPRYTPCTCLPVYMSGTGSCYTENVRFVRVVEGGRHDAQRGCLSSPQNKPSPCQETYLKRQRNPLQKARLHKEEQNLSTPPGMTSRPPKARDRPFTRFTVGLTLGSWPLFLAKSD